MTTVTKIESVHDWTYERPLLACRLDPQGRFVLTSAEDNLLQRVSMPDGGVTALPAVHDSWVQALAITPDGNTSISGGGDGRLVWWDTSSADCNPIRTVQAHTDWIRGLAISPDGRFVASGGYDGQVALWDLATGEVIRKWSQHANNVYSVEFLAASNRLASGDLNGVIYLWDVDQEEPVCKFDGAALHSFNAGQRVNFGGVRCLAINAAMTQLIAGGLHKSSNPLGAVHEPLAIRFSIADQAIVNNHVAEGIPGGGLWRIRYLDDDCVVGVSGGSTGGFLLVWNGGADPAAAKLALPSLARDMDLSADKTLVATTHYDRHVRIHRLA
jgi:WD40 repeat protein